MVPIMNAMKLYLKFWRW